MTMIIGETGHFISEEFERLARCVKEYDPQFELRYIPEETQVTKLDMQFPYIIWDTYTDTPVFYVPRGQTPEQILGRLFRADNSKSNVLERIEAEEIAAKTLYYKELQDKREEQMEYAAFLAKTSKNYIRLKGGRKVDDQLRPIL